MKSTVLYLVRHGAIASRSGKVFVGQSELPLNAQGVEQAHALRNWLQPVPFTQIYCSDLSRAQQTCRIIAGRRANSIKSLSSLREISLGEWENRSFEEIERHSPKEFAARGQDIENWRPPGGESFADCQARVMESLSKILEEAHGNVLMVGHAGVNRLILCGILGMPIANLHCLGQDYGCVNIIAYSESASRLRLLNFIPPSPLDRAPTSEESSCASAATIGSRD